MFFIMLIHFHRTPRVLFPEVGESEIDIGAPPSKIR